MFIYPDPVNSLGRYPRRWCNVWFVMRLLLKRVSGLQESRGFYCNGEDCTGHLEEQSHPERRGNLASQLPQRITVIAPKRLEIHFRINQGFDVPEFQSFGGPDSKSSIPDCATWWGVPAGPPSVQLGSRDSLDQVRRSETQSVFLHTESFNWRKSGEHDTRWSEGIKWQGGRGGIKQRSYSDSPQSTEGV